MANSEPDIRLCNVWLDYSDGEQLQLEIFLDIDSCIKAQVYESFDPVSPNPDMPYLVDFKWSDTEQDDADELLMSG
ncbi:MAG TPA: hypothetical protein EYQ00_10895 [Dehalococcoidia bacterium]|nr:hypothetical protein [Dehalococcoidia bacterium]